MKKLFVILLLAAAAPCFAQQKYALVIGNGAYTGSGMTRLANPVNDANDMTAALQALGFTVEKVLDGNLDSMETAITRLKNRLSVSKNTYGFIFYAGHGVQSGGVNYLIPVGASIPSENYLRERAVSVQAMLGELNDAGNELNVIVLDACRDNPFAWARSGSRGLTVVGNQPADSIIVFATSAGSTAADGTGKNGLFTTQLLKNLKTPGLEVAEVFRLTGADVAQVSERKQIPAVYNQFFGRAYLGAQPAPPPVAATPQPAPAPAPAVQPAPPPAPTPAPAAQPAASASTSANMVRIQGGTFTMGSPANEPQRGNNEIQHQVTVSSFYMGKYQVTQKEWYEVMGTNVRQQRDKVNPEGPMRGEGDNYPMYYVSWFEAVEYCNRRSQREGLTPAYTINGTNVTWNRNANGYRLPTEAQWEYACRAGTTTAYHTGAVISDNTGWYEANSGRTTHPVGQKTANAWGLYDMHGNVLEWCYDWYGSYASGAQTDPVGASSGSNRVVRGGSWDASTQVVRSAHRGSLNPTYRNNSFGFRLVRP